MYPFFPVAGGSGGDVLFARFSGLCSHFSDSAKLSRLGSFNLVSGRRGCPVPREKFSWLQLVPSTVRSGTLFSVDSLSEE